jgi:peptidoglycan/xylan/chitin deacetylase (PgdA/CDA1 family)
MRLVSPLLKHAVYPALHHTGCLDRITPNGSCSVVTYHGVVPKDYSSDDIFLDGHLVRPEVLRQQLQFLKAHYNVVHPDEFRAWIEQGKQLPPRAVLVTCDEGLLNALTDMLPVLQSEDVSCLFFVTAASCSHEPATLWFEELYLLMRANPLMDLQLPADAATSSMSFQARWWNALREASRLDAKTRADWMNELRSQCAPAQALRSESRWRPLNIIELKQLADSGMSIGAHSVTHPILSSCSEEEARREIQESKISLERALGRPVWAFAYPFGNPSTMGDRELCLASEAGFACAFLNVEHWDSQSDDRFALPRTHITSETTLPEFAAHLSGLHSRLQRAVRA